MTANPYTFSPGRSIDSLAIASICDPKSGYYTAYYVDMPFLVVQVRVKEQAQERLRDALMMYLKSICKH
jgi:hypothetical protein